jgi:hypothetical protein
MLKSLFGSKDLVDFSKQLAEDIRLRYPPEVANNTNKPVSVNRLTAILNGVFQQAADFSKEAKLGGIRKAKLANNFRWELTDAGYNKQFVEIATEGLVVYLTSPPKSSEQKPASK